MHGEKDLNILHQAVPLAVQGHGTAEPNPLVGCIITDKHNVIVGQGFHEQFGENHAEINALTMAGDAARGGTAYVTLEPCNHHGKTPPCTRALIDAGIRRVVIGCSDPNEQASGGVHALEEAGLDIEIIQDELCAEILAPFTHRCKTGLPWVTCKWAQTIDGCIETPVDSSNWISSKESQQLVHKERGCVDAIIVGVGTILADNPSLTVRHDLHFRTPVRVIIDPMLRTPVDAHIFDDRAPTLIAHCEEIDNSHIPCKTIALPTIGNSLDLEPLLKHLVTNYDATNVLVEGGATTFQHFFQQSHVNELWVFIAPTKSTMTPHINMNSLRDSLQITLIEENHCGIDTVQRYTVISD